MITPVTKVLPVKAGNPPKVLPHTGASVEPGPLADARSACSASVCC